MSNKTDNGANPSAAAPQGENQTDAFETLMKDFLPESDEVEDAVETEEEVETPEEDAPETEEADSEESDEDSDQEEEVEEKPKAQKRRKSPQKRIQGLLAEKRQLELELEQLRAQKETPASPKAAAAEGAPSPDATDDDGNPLYPLGEYDPAFLDAKFEYKWEQKRKEEAARQQQEQAQQQASKVAAEWTARLEEAEVGLPDIRETIADLEDTFVELEPEYGQMLAATIMSLDNGPEVLYYLAQNLDEADEIVASGPRKAVITLAKLDARFDAAKAPREKKAATKAPNPPRARTRGTSSSVETGSSVYDKMLREFR